MKSIQISKISGKEIFKDREKAHAHEAEVRKIWTKVWEDIQAEKYACVKMDNDFNERDLASRYVVHRSVKNPGALQLSAMTMERGKIMPKWYSYDEQYSTMEDFIDGMYSYSNGRRVDIIEWSDCLDD